MVEQVAVNHEVGGSKPSAGAFLKDISNAYQWLLFLLLIKILIYDKFLLKNLIFIKISIDNHYILLYNLARYYEILFIKKRIYPMRYFLYILQSSPHQLTQAISRGQSYNQFYVGYTENLK